MDSNRRVTRSTSNARRNPTETEGTYWGRVIDPTDIERGQVEAIRAVRRATSDDPTALLNTTQDAPPTNTQGGASKMDDEVPNNLLEEEIPFTSNLTNYTEQSLQLVNAMRTAFVNNSPSTPESVERMTTPVDMNILERDGPLDPAFTRPSLQRIEDLDLDTQLMKGPRETGNVTTDLLDQYMDENYTDVLRTSILNPNSYLSLPSVKTLPHHTQQRLMAMDWYVPDGSNRQIVEIPEKKIADFHSPGGGTGALILTLTRLLLHYNTTRYLVDIDTGEVFGWIADQWRRTGLYCASQPFVISELTAMTTRCSAALQIDVEQEQQTRVIQLTGVGKANTIPLPPLPLLPEPDVYVQHEDAMSLNMRRNYVRDRTQAALTYISEYETAQKWENDPQYDRQQVQQRLQIIYGKADQVKQKIDAALNNDDIHRRRRTMRTLGLPKRFPHPQNMKDSSVTTWITWVREESNELITAIDEEVTKRQDPDDPFDGTASGIFLPLRHENETPRQQEVQQVDESDNHNSQKGEPLEGRLVDIPNTRPQPNHHRKAETSEGGAVSRSEIQQDGRDIDVVHTSATRQEDLIRHNEREVHNELPTQTTTQRRIEESHTSSIFREPQPEDPFRTLRSFHEKQRGEWQQSNTHHTLVSLHSTLEGAVGGVGVDHPKPQRMTKKHQQHDQTRGTMQTQENYPRQDNQLQGLHNTTTYMTLPNSMQNKICGRCGLMGHIKRMCKEEVYCRYCKTYTHAAAACRTYPVTSSRKNTPEKRTVEDIEREVSRRVQEEMRRILNDLSTSRRVANTQQTLQTIQSSERKDVMDQTRGQHVQNLIGEFQRPPEVFERTIGNSNRTKEIDDQILNQQWEEPPHMQPPMVPIAVPTPQTQYTTMNTTNRKVEVPAERQQPNLPKEGLWDRAEKTSTLATSQQVEPLQENTQGNQFFSVQGNVSTPTGHRRPEQTNDKKCPGCTIRKGNSHTEREEPITNEVQGDCKRTAGSKKRGPPECKVIQVLPDEELDFMDLVRDSVSAQAKNGPKPMFVNNYFVGDNNWRATAREPPDERRQSDESKNRSSIAVQTAVSLLGEENKPARLVQTGISRMKAMNSNEGVYNTQSPVIVEPEGMEIRQDGQQIALTFPRFIRTHR